MCERMGLSIPATSKKRTLAWCYVCGKKLVVFNPLSLSPSAHSRYCLEPGWPEAPCLTGDT